MNNLNKLTKGDRWKNNVIGVSKLVDFGKVSIESASTRDSTDSSGLE